MCHVSATMFPSLPPALEASMGYIELPCVCDGPPGPATSLAQAACACPMLFGAPDVSALTSQVPQRSAAAYNNSVGSISARLWLCLAGAGASNSPLELVHRDAAAPLSQVTHRA